MAAELANQLRMAAALHVTGCMAVSGTCVILGCSSGPSADYTLAHRGGSLTAVLWGATPKPITDYWRLHCSMKTSCLSTAEYA